MCQQGDPDQLGRSVSVTQTSQEKETPVYTAEVTAKARPLGNRPQRRDREAPSHRLLSGRSKKKERQNSNPEKWLRKKNTRRKEDEI